MERGPEYSQIGLPSPYPSNFGDTQSEVSSADHASAAAYPSGQEARSANYSTSATPTSSEYGGGVFPQSARSSSFPEHIQRAYHPASNHSGSSGGMAQTPTSPSMPLPDGRNHQSQQVKSDNELPIDPNITAPSPTYPHQQYSPYGAPPPGDMSHGYAQGSMYNQPRPDWGNYGHPGGHMGQPQSVFTPTSAAPPGRPAQVGCCCVSPSFGRQGVEFATRRFACHGWGPVVTLFVDGVRRVANPSHIWTRETTCCA